MVQDLSAAIEGFLAPDHLQMCLLVVHLDPARLEKAGRELKTGRELPVIEIGRELSQALAPVEVAQRPRQAAAWFSARLREQRPGPALCTNTDVLFEPSLRLHPLQLVVTASRTTRLIFLWAGAFENDTLSYAVPAHAHYRSWRHPQVAIATLA